MTWKEGDAKAEKLSLGGAGDLTSSPGVTEGKKVSNSIKIFAEGLNGPLCMYTFRRILDHNICAFNIHS